MVHNDFLIKTEEIGKRVSLMGPPWEPSWEPGLTGFQDLLRMIPSSPNPSETMHSRGLDKTFMFSNFCNIILTVIDFCLIFTLIQALSSFARWGLHSVLAKPPLITLACWDTFIFWISVLFAVFHPYRFHNSPFVLFNRWNTLICQVTPSS